MENALSLNNISFSYNSKQPSVIKDFSLQVQKGSFTTLLGSSGSGKTTILKLISGFLFPSEGQIFVNGKLVNDVAPEDRKIGMVFQDYALFPHMNVKNNLLYGLKIKNKKQKKENRKTDDELYSILEKTANSLDLLNLLDRFPNELSGGQQQRLALGRALVLEPQILLMDEPLSSLDTKLRQNLRTELKDLQQRLNITTIYVTHDQEEALFLSDKIAVLNQGKLVQYASSKDIYFSPADRFTAEFIGNANFIQINNQQYMIRPEWINIKNKKEKSDDVEAKVISKDFLGNKFRYKLDYNNQIIFADLSSAYLTEYNKNDVVYLDFICKKLFS